MGSGACSRPRSRSPTRCNIGRSQSPDSARPSLPTDGSPFASGCEATSACGHDVLCVIEQLNAGRPSQSPTPARPGDIVEASRPLLALEAFDVCVQRYGYCDYSFSLFFNSLLLERPFFPPCVPLALCHRRSGLHSLAAVVHSPRKRSFQPDAGTS